MAPPAPDASPVPPDAEMHLDDRSTGLSLMRSFASAINLRQSTRAYAYWEAGPSAPAWDAFRAQWAPVASQRLTTGTVGLEVGAVQTRYLVPALAVATLDDGTRQVTAGCYSLHLGLPSGQAVPPFQPLTIVAASVQPAPEAADPSPPPVATCH